jgi:hypothetical protein
MTIALLCAAAFVLYPMFVGVSYRFLGKRDGLGIIHALGTTACCPRCERPLDIDNECKCTGGYVRYGGVRREPFMRRKVGNTPWVGSALWPLTWSVILIVYLAYWLLWIPVKALALATAKTAQLTSGERN